MSYGFREDSHANRPICRDHSQREAQRLRPVSVRFSTFLALVLLNETVLFWALNKQ